MALSQTTTKDSGIPKSTTAVGIRLMFQRIGEIDTMNEKYQAQASIEARWIVPLDGVFTILSSTDQKNLSDGKSVTLVKYAETHWHPQLFVENALGELKEQIRYSAKKISDDQVCICEHRDIKGVFWEKLELHHFPSDVQELSISIGSMLYDDKVVLIPDPYYHSGVNREAFVDQQEWSLYEHVESSQRFVREFFDSIGDQENIGFGLAEGRKRSFLTVSCRAERTSGYFYWNGYCLIFLITLCGFTIFSMPPHLPHNRLQTAATLLLTSITFRWTVNRSLPTISYLTSMDKYAIISIFILVALCIWHAIIGAIIFIKNNFVSIATDQYAWIDRGVFLFLFFSYLIMHIVMIIWLYKGPLARRRELKRKDRQYREEVRKSMTEDHHSKRSYVLNLPHRSNYDDGYELKTLIPK